MTKPGHDFEKAVYSFAKTLGSSAEVLFDHKVLDRDTGTFRQCDVWINAKYGGHWPLTILVSCKDHSRKLDVGDIGTFCDEIRSVGASTGVIYSRRGFTKPALKKAKTNSISCCRLYQHESPDIPSSIWFEHFSCRPNAQLALTTDLRNSQFKIWNDLFNIKRDDGTSILDVIVETFVEEFNKAITGKKPNTLPEDWGMEITFKDDSSDEDLSIQVWGRWKIYRAKEEASLLNGSYCVTNESFIGEIIGPTIDLKGNNPRILWEEITDKDFILPQNHILSIHSGFNITSAKKLFRSRFGDNNFYSQTS